MDLWQVNCGLTIDRSVVSMTTCILIRVTISVNLKYHIMIIVYHSVFIVRRALVLEIRVSTRVSDLDFRTSKIISPRSV